MYLQMKNAECFTALVDSEQAADGWLKVHKQRFFKQDSQVEVEFYLILVCVFQSKIFIEFIVQNVTKKNIEKSPVSFTRFTPQ